MNSYNELLIHVMTEILGKERRVGVSLHSYLLTWISLRYY